MKYTVTTPVMAQAEAEEFGKWLAKYKVEIAGLEVWQVTASGKRYKDDPLADTVKDLAGQAATSVAGAQVGASVLIPIVGLIPHVAILALAASLPGLIWAQFKLRKKVPKTVSKFGKDDPLVTSEASSSTSPG